MNNLHERKNKGICRICGAVKVKDSKPEFMASGTICVDCYYKHVEPDNKSFSKKEQQNLFNN
jgi:hypothetical protein